MFENKRLLTEIEVAAQLQISEKTLRNWRQDRKGLNYVKVGANVRYKQKDIDEYIEQHTINL